MSQPENVPAETSDDASTKRWTIGILIAVVAIVGICVARQSSSKPTEADEQRDAQRACEEQFIPKRLKSPATAEFSGVTVSGSGGTYRVTGSVDSQNSFGALVRSTFTCAVHSSGDRWVLDSATVNG